MSPKTWIAAVAVIAMIGAPHAEANDKNEVRAVTFTEDAGTTRVHVRGEQTPTFTVYKLERPSRVVIDLPGARLAESLRGHESATVLSANTWAVSTIAAQQLDDGAVRVIVTLARPGRYDVKTDGNEVVIMVMPRDAAPKTANPAELARVQAESEQAKKQAQAAEQARAAAERSSEAANATAKQIRAEADMAKAEAERLRKVAAEQAARAGVAQRAVDEAKKLREKNAASAADLERAKQLASAAKDEAARAKADAAKAGNEAEKARTEAAIAQIEADKKRVAAEQARRDALAETAAAKAEAARARSEMAKTQADAAKARSEMAKTQADAAKARDEMAKTQAEAAKARDEVARTQAEMMKTRAEAEQAKSDVARAQAEAQAMIAKSRAEAEAAKSEVVRARTEASAAMNEIARVKTEADAARSESERARSEAARAKSEAANMRAQAESDRQKAEAARGDAEKMLKDAKAQLVTIEKKSQAAQALEDRARAALATAQAREEAARETAASAMREREVAEAAAKRAAVARDKSAAADRAQLVAEAKAAEERLAKARAATDEADARRRAAEQAASLARQELERSKSALAGVEHQRATATAAATDAARKRGEAEAAASEAARKRSEAEVAATEATKMRREAEAQRIAAEEATRAAEKQRQVAEAAAQQAIVAKREAELSLATLSSKRAAAERAADAVAARMKAEAKAQAEMTAAKARKASDDEIAAARREVARLAEERKRAESELADRRKAVAHQQAEATRLETAAAQARDAAAREEVRRERLAGQRAAEEQELARVRAQKVRAQVASQSPGGTSSQGVPRGEPSGQGVADPCFAAGRRSIDCPRAQAQSAPAQTRSTPAPKPASTPAKVSNVTFKGNDAAGIVEIAMAGDASISLGEASATHVELIVDNAELAAKLERTLDVSRFGSPVKKISSYRDRRATNRVRLVAELASPAIPTVVRDANVVRWRFAGSGTAQRTPRTQNIPPTVVGGFGAASTPVAQQSVSQVPPGRGRRIYHGATVEFDFKDAPIHDLLRIIADTGGVNIVVPDSIDAKVTVRLKRVPWDQALEVILASHGLWYRKEGNLYRIAPRKELDAEDEAEAARRAAMVAAEMPKPEVVTLNYASADELRAKLEGMLSPKGKIEVDGRTNSLIINDVGGNREQIARLALQLDTQTPQITIEARIVEARSTFVRQFGIQWGGRALMSAAGGNATGLIFPSSFGLRGGNSDPQTNDNGISALPSDFAINLPAATGSGEGGAIGLSLGSVGGNFNINLRLSALEDTGTVRIISAPKITVLNNKSALIKQGVSIPISVVSAAGTNTQFVQADLKLEVTPYVSQRDCAIAMNLDVTKNEPDFVNVGARGDPSILRKEAKTTMLVADGDTTVLGGIYTRNTGLAYKKVPFFGDLPVIGWFFKNRRENDDRTEILVFITPKITNKASLRCAQ